MNMQPEAVAVCVAIVTGAGSGIGRAVAIRLAADGYRVVLAGRRCEALEETASCIAPGLTKVVVCDVTHPPAIEALIGQALAAFGRIDVLVNNAGISRTAPLEQVTLQAWREVMAVDVESVVLMTQAALPALLASGGSVVNIASVAGLGGDYAMTSYNAAKGAVVNLTRSMAVEFAARGVRVNAVAPSLTTTDAVADISEDDLHAFVSRIPMGRAAVPAEVAGAVAFLAGPDASFITGAILPVDGGLRACSGQPRCR